MTDAMTLRAQVRSGAALRMPYYALGDDLDVHAGTADALFVDLQHAPASDAEVIELCRRATEYALPVVLRLRHPAEAYLAGRYADFGAAGIIVPMVEDVETVQSACDWFHYPPLGRRSWGPTPQAYQRQPDEGPQGYIPRWEAAGLLALQLETAAACRAAPDLVLPGVDLVVFGEADLAIDCAARPQSGFRDAQAAMAHVAKALTATNVRCVTTGMPFGAMPAQASIA